MPSWCGTRPQRSDGGRSDGRRAGEIKPARGDREFHRVRRDLVVGGLGVEFLRRLVVRRLPKRRDEITRVVQLLVKRPHLGLQRKETHGASAVRIASGEHGLARRLADRDRGVGALVVQPLRGELVNVRREVFDGAAIDAAGNEVHVVRGAEQDVQRSGQGGSAEEAEEGEELHGGCGLRAISARRPAREFESSAGTRCPGGDDALAERLAPGTPGRVPGPG